MRQASETYSKTVVINNNNNNNINNNVLTPVHNSAARECGLLPQTQ